MQVLLLDELALDALKLVVQLVEGLLAGGLLGLEDALELVGLVGECVLQLLVATPLLL